MTMAGPALAAAACPVSTKIPAPMMLPIPSAVKLQRGQSPLERNAVVGRQLLGDGLGSSGLKRRDWLRRPKIHHSNFLLKDRLREVSICTMRPIAPGPLRWVPSGAVEFSRLNGPGPMLNEE